MPVLHDEPPSDRDPLIDLLTARFGSLPTNLTAAIRQAGATQRKAWFVPAATSASLDVFCREIGFESPWWWRR